MNTAELQQNAIDRSQQTAETARSSEEPLDLMSRPTQTEKSPKRRRRITGTIVALIVIGSLVLGYLPRWRQRRTATADMNELAIPTVSVVSPAPGKPGNGLVLPAGVRPWREASIFARPNGYLKSWLPAVGAHSQAGQLLAETEPPDLNKQSRK